MNIKQKGLALGTLLAAFGFAACQPAATNTTVAVNGNKSVVTTNSNTAVVVDNHPTNSMTANTMSGTMNWNSNMARADYDKDRAKYEAEKGTSTIGTGANDSWLWFKTRAAMAATNDLRESTINVDVNNDVITLKGTVATAEQKAKAVSVAKGIDGQKGIKDELKVAPADSMTNTNANSMINGNKR